MFWILSFPLRRLLTVAQNSSPDSATAEVCKLYERFTDLALTIGNSRAFTVLHILAGVPKGAVLALPRAQFLTRSHTQCYAQADDPVECRPQSEDYLECLHRPKEVRYYILFSPYC
jgi:hypothetical protein